MNEKTRKRKIGARRAEGSGRAVGIKTMIFHSKPSSKKNSALFKGYMPEGGNLHSGKGILFVKYGLRFRGELAISALTGFRFRGINRITFQGDRGRESIPIIRWLRVRSFRCSPRCFQKAIPRVRGGARSADPRTAVFRPEPMGRRTVRGT